MGNWWDPRDWGKEIEKGFNDYIVKPVEKGANDAINVIVDGTTQTYSKTAKVVDDSGKFITNVAKDTYNYSVAFAIDTTYRTKDAGYYIAKNTEEFGKVGLAVTQKEFIELSKQAEKQIIDGVEVVKYGAEYAYKWLDENACRLGLTAAISMGFVAAFTPKPAPGDPGTITSAAVSTTYVSMIAAGVANTAIAAAITELVIEPIWLIPGVNGSCDKNLLKAMVSNCIYYSITTSGALWASGAGVGIAMGAAVAPILATFICTRTMPNGFTKYITDEFNKAKISETFMKIAVPKPPNRIKPFPGV
jgi:hypothetical protein